MTICKKVLSLAAIICLLGGYTGCITNDSGASAMADGAGGEDLYAEETETESTSTAGINLTGEDDCKAMKKAKKGKAKPKKKCKKKKKKKK